MLEITDHLFEILACATLVGLIAAIQQQRMALLRLRTMICCEHSERQTLENDFAALLSCSKNIGERVRSQDLRQHTILKKTDGIDFHRDANNGQPYTQVHKLVEQGMEIDTIVEVCNLARGEVELLSHFAEYRSAA